MGEKHWLWIWYHFLKIKRELEAISRDNNQEVSEISKKAKTIKIRVENQQKSTTQQVNED